MKIDRHIPLPVAPTQERKERVPVEQMELGDSVFLPMPRRSALGTVKATAMRAGLKHNYRSAIEGDGARVWRIA